MAENTLAYQISAMAQQLSSGRQTLFDQQLANQDFTNQLQARQGQLEAPQKQLNAAAEAKAAAEREKQQQKKQQDKLKKHKRH